MVQTRHSLRHSGLSSATVARSAARSSVMASGRSKRGLTARPDTSAVLEASAPVVDRSKTASRRGKQSVTETTPTPSIPATAVAVSPREGDTEGGALTAKPKGRKTGVITPQKDMTALTKKPVAPKKSASPKKPVSPIRAPAPAVNLRSLDEILADAAKLSSSKGKWHVADALRHLLSVEKRFVPVIQEFDIPDLYRQQDSIPIHQDSPYTALLRTIVYQQLSAKSAAPIFARFHAAITADSHIDPADVAKANFAVELIDGKKKILVNGQVVGLSESKAKYIQDLTDHFLDPARLQGVDLLALSDEELMQRLLAVKGLGRWSVEMYMIFQLHRANVLPVGDLAVGRSIGDFYGVSGSVGKLKDKQRFEELERLCAHWAPYRTLGTLYMWRLREKLGAKDQ